MPRTLPILAALCAALTLAACGGDAKSSASGSSTGSGSGSSTTASIQGGSINGAGATFPQPVYQEWGAELQGTSQITVNYQGVGSGAGIEQFTAGTVDFGATDSAMKDEEVEAAEAKGEPVHVPTVLGAVTVSYNVKGVEKGLKLDGKTVADIFLGKVEQWNDPEIAKQNDGVRLPANPITVCHRSDESGTTGNFTKFLADESPEWESGPGTDKSVKWPTGTGAKGNDGVAACIKQNDDSVGYVEQAFALANDFTFASIKNKAGQYSEPTLEAASAAGEGAAPPEDLRFSTINAEGEQTYPITAVTFLLVYQDMCKAGLEKAKAQRVQAWLDFGLGQGQEIAPKLEYAPLPESIKSRAQAKVDALQCNGSPLKGA